MSETVPEPQPAPRRRGGRAAGLLTERIGPLPMWGWVAIIGGAIIAWRVWSSRQSAAAASAATGSTAADQVPQFVNQTYTTVTAPEQEPPQPGIIPHEPIPKPKQKRLQREWTAPRSGGTLAEVAQRLTGRPMPSLLTPANAIAQKFIEGPYKKNPHAPIPKGAQFTYLEGQVT